VLSPSGLVVFHLRASARIFLGSDFLQGYVMVNSNANGPEYGCDGAYGENCKRRSKSAAPAGAE